MLKAARAFCFVGPNRLRAWRPRHGDWELHPKAVGCQPKDAQNAAKSPQVSRTAIVRHLSPKRGASLSTMVTPRTLRSSNLAPNRMLETSTATRSRNPRCSEPGGPFHTSTSERNGILRSAEHNFDAQSQARDVDINEKSQSSKLKNYFGARRTCGEHAARTRRTCRMRHTRRTCRTCRTASTRRTHGEHMANTLHTPNKWNTPNMSNEPNMTNTPRRANGEHAAYTWRARGEHTANTRQQR